MKTIVALFCMLSWGAQANAIEITWLLFDMPPSWIVAGPDKDQGIVDVQTRLIQEKLGKGFTHKKKMVTASRFLAEMTEQKDKVFCNGAWLDSPEDRKNFAYSTISEVTIPLVIISRKNESQSFGPPMNTVSLDDLITTKPKLRLGLVEDRPYGEGIDAILAKRKASKNIIYLNAGTVSTPLDMIFKNRFEYTIDYPESIGQVAAKNSVEEDSVAIHFIKEQANCIPYYVVCSNNADGKRVISEVNKILGRIQNSDPFLEASRKWYIKEFMPFWSRCRHEVDNRLNSFL